ncbi:MAG: hypothetical protein ACRDRX_11305 [Pseudonocardiaceae bacterium]
MTDASATGPDPGVDSDETRTLRGEMVTALINDGVLPDDRWRHVFRAVPRHVLVPTYYHANAQINGGPTPSPRRAPCPAWWR